MKNQIKAPKLQKHDMYAQIWHLIHYVEEFVVSGKKCDLSVLTKKCAQAKKILTDYES